MSDSDRATAAASGAAGAKSDVTSDVTADAATAEPAVSPSAGLARKRHGWTSLALMAAGAAGALTFGIVGAGLRPSAPLVILTAGGAALVFCGISLYRVLEPLLRPSAFAARMAESRQSTRLRELEREKALVLKAIREIEHDFHMRKISESDYKEMTHRYRTRALRLIREIDAGDDFRGLIEQELKTRLAAQAATSPGPAAAAPVAKSS